MNSASPLSCQASEYVQSLLLDLDLNFSIKAYESSELRVNEQAVQKMRTK